ncbi:MAG: T9SS type A sorting domain-containing protein [Flavobacteriales bacterium]
MDLKAQMNLIPNGSFEDRRDYTYPATENDPLIPCVWGGLFNNIINDDYLTSSDPVLGWGKIGLSQTDRSQNPDVFDSRRGTPCEPLFINNSQCLYYNCSQYQREVSIPENFYGTFPHRLPIPQGGYGRYVGLRRDNVQHKPGIYCKLKKKLKANHTYHLRFYAIRADGNGASHELEIRFCKSDNWNNESSLNYGQIKEIKKDVISTSTWELIDIPFSVDDCDVEYLMIRLNPKPGRKILLDDFELLDNCSVGKECSSTLSDDIDNINVNDEHTSTNPLTFSNLTSITTVTIVIEKLVGVNGGFIPVRYYYLTNPPPTFSWDGFDMLGNTLSNGIYRYFAYFTNDCRCIEKQKIFLKTGNPPGINLGVTFGTNIQSGAFTVYNLSQVHFLELIIKTVNGQNIRTITINNPTHAISWDGFMDGGYSAIASGGNNFIFQLKVSNNCATNRFSGNFYQQSLGTNAIEFDYSDGPIKPIANCPFNFDERPFPRPPVPCCNLQPHLTLSNEILIGQAEYLLNQTITAGPNVVIERYADILFQAGVQINLLPGFVALPGSEFIARIAPCDRSYSNPVPQPSYVYLNTDYDSIPDSKSLEVVQPIEIIAYPNPTATGIFTLQMKNGTDSFQGNLDLFNVKGENVYSNRLTTSVAHSIIVSHLENGVYFGRIIEMDTTLFFKIVIQK